MFHFTAEIFKIGINPYVIPPAAVLQALFQEAGKEKGPIPVRINLNKTTFHQTLVRYAGEWRLYLNNPMRLKLQKDVGDTIDVSIAFDPVPRTVAMHPKLKLALQKNKQAKSVFDKLVPSYQKEIVRYISHLKTEEAVDTNVAKAIQHLLGKQRFIGREAVTTMSKRERG